MRAEALRHSSSQNHKSHFVQLLILVFILSMIAPSFGVPDANQRSVCSGESGGIGRFNEREALNLCGPIAERESL